MLLLYDSYMPMHTKLFNIPSYMYQLGGFMMIKNPIISVFALAEDISGTIFKKTDTSGHTPASNVTELFSAQVYDIIDCAVVCASQSSCQSTFYSPLNHVCRGYSREGLRFATFVPDSNTINYEVSSSSSERSMWISCCQLSVNIITMQNDDTL